MTTRAELRTRVRQELNDTGGTSLWSDTLLNTWLVEALRELGRDLGRELTSSITTVADQAAYSLGSDVLQVVRVEHPAGYFRKPVALRSGDVSPDAEITIDGPSGGRLHPAELRYEVWAGELVLSPAPDAAGETISVRYVAAYLEPAADATVLDVPARDEDLVVWLVGRRAYRWIEGDEAKRMRFERQRGAAPFQAARDMEQRYTDALSQRRARVASRRLAIRG